MTTKLREGYDKLLGESKTILDLPLLPVGASEIEIWHAAHYIAIERLINSAEWVDVKPHIHRWSLKECRALAKVLLTKAAVKVIDAELRKTKRNTQVLNQIRFTLEAAITSWCETTQLALWWLTNLPEAPEAEAPLEQEARWLFAESQMTVPL